MNQMFKASTWVRTLSVALMMAGDFAAAATTVVDIQGMTFVPQRLVVAQGTTVTWTNSTAMIHTVTFNQALARLPGSASVPEGVVPFDSGLVRAGQVFAHTFEVPGAYRYFCRPHESMGHLGELIVVADAPEVRLLPETVVLAEMHAFAGQGVRWVNHSGLPATLSITSLSRTDDAGAPVQLLAPVSIADQEDFVWTTEGEELLLVSLTTEYQELRHELKVWSK